MNSVTYKTGSLPRLYQKQEEPGYELGAFVLHLVSVRHGVIIMYTT